MNVVESTNNLYVTKKEFCKICGISESTAYKLIKNKKVNSEKRCDGRSIITLSLSKKQNDISIRERIVAYLRKSKFQVSKPITETRCEIILK